jgi:hypothetical protein
VSQKPHEAPDCTCKGCIPFAWERFCRVMLKYHPELDGQPMPPLLPSLVRMTGLRDLRDDMMIEHALIDRIEGALRAKAAGT